MLPDQPGLPAREWKHRDGRAVTETEAELLDDVTPAHFDLAEAIWRDRIKAAEIIPRVGRRAGVAVMTGHELIETARPENEPTPEIRAAADVADVIAGRERHIRIFECGHMPQAIYPDTRVLMRPDRVRRDSART